MIASELEQRVILAAEVNCTNSPTKFDTRGRDTATLKPHLGCLVCSGLFHEQRWTEVARKRGWRCAQETSGTPCVCYLRTRRGHEDHKPHKGAMQAAINKTTTGSAATENGIFARELYFVRIGRKTVSHTRSPCRCRCSDSSLFYSPQFCCGGIIRGCSSLSNRMIAKHHGILTEFEGHI